MLGFGRYLGADPLEEIFLPGAQALREDAFGNLVFSAQAMVHVLCLENQQAPYCVRRTTGRVYTVAGSDGVADGRHGGLASSTPMGVVSDVEVGVSGNLYIADRTFARVRVVCIRTDALGFCQGRVPNHVYHLLGDGTALTSPPAVLGSSARLPRASIGVPSALAEDASGNLLFGDEGMHRVRIYCENTTGLCDGLASNQVHPLIGTGTVADGVEGAARAVPMGAVAGDYGALRVIVP